MLFLPGADQRLFDRFHILDTGCLDSDSRSESVSCEILDVSLSGLQIRSREPLAIGEDCQLTIGRRRGDEFVIHGKVCYTNVCEDDGTEVVYASGLKFIPRSIEERTAIAKYINAAFMRECPLIRPSMKKAA